MAALILENEWAKLQQNRPYELFIKSLAAQAHWMTQARFDANGAAALLLDKPSRAKHLRTLPELL